MQLGHAAQAQPPCKFMTQVMPGMFQCRKGVLLFPPVAVQGYFYLGVTGIRADVDLRDCHDPEPWIGHFKPDNLSELFADRLRDPRCPPFIHAVATWNV